MSFCEIRNILNFQLKNEKNIAAQGKETSSENAGGNVPLKTIYYVNQKKKAFSVTSTDSEKLRLLEAGAEKSSGRIF